MKSDGSIQQGAGFAFLQVLWPDLFALAVEAENTANSMPDFSAVRLRGFTEAMVVYIFNHISLQLVNDESLFDRLRILEEDGYLGSEILSKFHTIRKLGNKAAHNGSISTCQADSLIEDAWSLAAWFCRFMRPDLEWLTTGRTAPSEPASNPTAAQTNSTALGDRGQIVVRFPEERVKRIHELANAALTQLAPEVRQLRTRITLRESFEVELNEDQEHCLSALETFLTDNRQRIFLLKGFAGTGKTFLAAGLTEFFLAQGRNFSLAAPTGRAAKVIASKTKQSARTVHSLIYDYGDMTEEGDEGSPTFKMIAKVAQNRSPINSVYIVDEASLVSDVYSESEFFRSGSGYLLHDLMTHIGLDQPESARKIIFIGDPAQLPPIGMSSSPALDPRYLRQTFGLEASGYELTEIVRQNDDSMVLQNVKPLRESLSNGHFGGLSFTFDDDVVRLDKDRVSQLYMKIREEGGADAPIIITHSNAEASEFNRAIRSKLFPGREFVSAGDTVIAAANGFCATHYIANGEILQIDSVEQMVERRSVQLKQKVGETGQTETIDVALSFRDVKVVLPQPEGNDLILVTKILEDFLHGNDARLDPVVQRALYVDFLRRHKHLNRKTERDEFRLALRADPYFNALRLRFGYAITCHKAQGGEWSHVIVSCPTRQNPRSAEFFRWLYTAMTRTNSKLYLVDPPNIHLRPVGPAWVDPSQGEDAEERDLSTARTYTDGLSQPVDVAQDFSPQVAFERWLHEEVRSRTVEAGIETEDIAHHPYREVYFLKRGADSVRIDISYKGNFAISGIAAPRPGPLSEEILQHLDAIVGKKPSVAIAGGGQSISPTRPFLKEFHERLLAALSNKAISVSNLEEQTWNQRYSLMRGSDEVMVDIFFNGKDQLTKFMAVNPKLNPEPTLVELQNDLMAVLTSEIRP